MKTITSIICLTLAITACAPRAAQPLTKLSANSDIRKISAINNLGGAGDVGEMAIRTCDSEGKKLEVVSTSIQRGILGGTYPVIMFRCVAR